MIPIKLATNARILLVRTDKIGDLILTTPALMSLKETYLNAYIGFLCRSQSAPILENNPAVDRIIRTDAQGESFWSLVQTIRMERFDVAIHFYAETRSILITAFAGVPLRVGPFSKVAAILLNCRIAQNRSQVKKHEAEYNLDLAKACGAERIVKKSVLILTEREKKFGTDQISGMIKNPARKPIVIHSGSAGSAKNWPIENYIALAQRLVRELGEVIFTTGPGEEWIAKKVEMLLNPSIHVFHGEKFGLRDLAVILAGARMVVSSSTGPLHMAVALGTPTCSFYPTTPEVTSSKRWGPFGDPNINLVLTPEGGSVDMASILADRAFSAVSKLCSDLGV